MLTSIESFFIEVIAPGFFSLDFTHKIPQQGTNIHATIALSSVETSLPNVLPPDPHFNAVARIVSWTVHLTGGGEGPRTFADSTSQNAVSVPNCASITFSLFAERAAAKALINVII
jgi:hypothetical protein